MSSSWSDASGVIPEHWRRRGSVAYDGKLAAGKAYDESLRCAADNLPRLNIGIGVGPQRCAVRERDVEHTTIGGHFGDDSSCQILHRQTSAVLIQTDGVTNVRVEAWLGLGARIEYDSLVIPELNDRPTYKEVDLTHAQRLRRVSGDIAERSRTGRCLAPGGCSCLCWPG